MSRTPRRCELTTCRARAISAFRPRVANSFEGSKSTRASVDKVRGENVAAARNALERNSISFLRIFATNNIGNTSALLSLAKMMTDFEINSLRTGL